MPKAITGMVPGAFAETIHNRMYNCWWWSQRGFWQFWMFVLVLNNNLIVQGKKLLYWNANNLIDQGKEPQYLKY